MGIQPKLKVHDSKLGTQASHCSSRSKLRSRATQLVLQIEMPYALTMIYVYMSNVPGVIQNQCCDK